MRCLSWSSTEILNNLALITFFCSTISPIQVCRVNSHTFSLLGRVISRCLRDYLCVLSQALIVKQPEVKGYGVLILISPPMLPSMKKLTLGSLTLSSLLILKCLRN
ncbi:hypothetical protein BCV72DRAFT_322903 [Rhizopus microsporus var. microsporus]|uniref:Uncharacterized protein n=1 Tax=Rhizopus microsporus var. microsporus TaxID=86635 RepID=A0A1X0QN51_RHIZD|nr:hypothetical protein BCV72DRAFT_322903 [Rhizopus microsporus var. microsporus]